MKFDLAVIGGGPAGMMAALVAKQLGVDPLIIDDNPILGGQLIKQTHKFFGSKAYYCGTRGFQIGEILLDEIEKQNITVKTGTTVTGIYPGFTLGTYDDNKYAEIEAKALIITTGAREKFLTFKNNDLPGVYGAGAVQTLMNVYGVSPGRKALMIGSGNIGLIVSYQLLQAGVDVPYLVEILPEIGGWHVHAAKIARAGVKILTRHTICSALGNGRVTGAVIAQVNDQWQIIADSKEKVSCDLICLSCGLSPLADLLWQIGCKMNYIPELGGYLPWHNEDMVTSIPGITVAGDVAGVEEATTAMLEGRIAGTSAVSYLIGKNPEIIQVVESAKRELKTIRAGDFSVSIKEGLRKLWQ